MNETVHKALLADPPTWADPPNPPESSGRMKALADGVFAAVKAFVDRRVDKSHGGLVAAMLELTAAIEKHAQPQHQIGRHSEHLARIETRLAKLERGQKQ